MNKQAIRYNVKDLLKGISTIGQLLTAALLIIIGCSVFSTACCLALCTFPLWIVLYVFTGYNIIDPCWNFSLKFMDMGERLID